MAISKNLSTARDKERNGSLRIFIGYVSIKIASVDWVYTMTIRSNKLFEWLTETPKVFCSFPLSIITYNSSTAS